MSDYDKLWIQQRINDLARQSAAAMIQGTGRALPCTVTAVDGSIVTVKFEATAPWTLPPLTLPKAESQWLRAPTQIGDAGLTLPADTFLGGVSGLGDGIADLTKDYGNLSTLVWVPIAAVGFGPAPDPDKAWVNGPAGAVVSDTAQTAALVVDPNKVVITTADGSMTITVDNTVPGSGVITIDCFGNTIVVDQDPSITMTSGDTVTKLDAAARKITHTIAGSGPGGEAAETVIDGALNQITHTLTTATGQMQTLIDGATNQMIHSIPSGAKLGLGGDPTTLGATAKAMANVDLSQYQSDSLTQRTNDLENMAAAIVVGFATSSPPVTVSAATIIAALASLIPVPVPAGGAAYIKPA